MVLCREMWPSTFLVVTNQAVVVEVVEVVVVVVVSVEVSEVLMGVLVGGVPPPAVEHPVS